MVSGGDDLCFMLMDVETVETFTGPASLLQKEKADPSPSAAYCGIKMSVLATGYKPKGEWKKTARDFGGGSMDAKADLTEYSAPTLADLTMGAVTLEKAP